MNRSAVREFQAPDVRVRRGELLVPTQVGDPAHGPLPCPAAPLIAGSLQRKGLRCALGPVLRLDEAGRDAGGAAVYLNGKRVATETTEPITLSCSRAHCSVMSTG